MQPGFKAGSKEEWPDSMAEAMETAFREEWRKYMNVPLPDEGTEYRRMLFAAIAQGVVRHLVDKARDAFDVDVVTTQVIGTTPLGATGSPITSDNKTSILLTGDWQIREGDAVVVQREDSTVVSEGKATVANVRYSGTLYNVG